MIGQGFHTGEAGHHSPLRPNSTSTFDSLLQAPYMTLRHRTIYGAGDYLGLHKFIRFGFITIYDCRCVLVNIHWQNRLGELRRAKDE